MHLQATQPTLVRLCLARRSVPAHLHEGIQVRWARGHRGPKKTHSLQDYQDRIGNELADLAARAGSTVHPCRGLGGTSPADILLNNHVIPSPARKWIIKSRPQKLAPDAHWKSWLPSRAVNRDTWGPGLWGTLRLLGFGAPWETGPVMCPRCGRRHGLAVQECLLSCSSESRFWDIWTNAWETWKPEATKWRQTASTDELCMWNPAGTPFERRNPRCNPCRNPLPALEPPPSSAETPFQQSGGRVSRFFFNSWRKFHQVSIKSTHSSSWVSNRVKFGYLFGMTYPHQDDGGGVAGGTSVAPCPTPVAPFARPCASSRTSRGCYNAVKTMPSPMSSGAISIS